MILSALALLALSAAPEASDPPVPAPSARAQPSRAADTAVTEAARVWLELVDAGKWQESWAATGQAFQSLNTAAAWQSASETARVPLGRVLSRTLMTEESVPVPPRGYRIVRFRTSFAAKADATETVSLAREGADWKVVGCFIE